MASAHNTNTSKKTYGVLGAIYITLLLTVFIGIVLHAPISVGFGVLIPKYDLLIKSWKEILMGLALVIALVSITRLKAWKQFNTPVIWLIGAFALVNILLIPFFYKGFDATVAGLFINLRYLLFFLLVYVALVLYPSAYKLFIKAFFVGAAIVIGFALLQITVLPHDILKYIGYSTTTISPFLTVDQNMDYIRINSTLRGPNPLGAYAMMALALGAALLLSRLRALSRRDTWLLSVLAIGSALTIWVTYARSALIGTAAAIGIVLLVLYRGKISRAVWISLAAIVLGLGVLTFVFKDTQFVSQVVLHEDPEEGGTVNSNDGHAESLVEGTTRMLQQPFGAGIGSTGSASLLSDAPFIVESQYLFIAHEVGWLGLVLFVIIFWLVLTQLWRKRQHWFALGVFASGIGLAIIGLLLPVFTDDTVAIVWWGLAAVAICMPFKKVHP